MGQWTHGRRQREITMLCIFVFALFFTACGGGGGGGSSSGGGASSGASGAVSGQLRASYVNGVVFCVSETLGTQNPICDTTKNQGNFTLQNAVGKGLTMAFPKAGDPTHGVVVGTIDASQVAANLTITPTMLAGGDAAQAQKITALFHQTGTNSGSGDSMLCDLSNVSITSADAININTWITNGRSDTFSLNGKTIDPSKETVQTTTGGGSQSTTTSGGTQTTTSSGSQTTTGGGSQTTIAHDTWKAVSTASISSRYGHIAVWTGSKMIVWGGSNSTGWIYNNGGVYDPVTDAWSLISTTNAPPKRSDHSAVWTGSEMIIWGGGYSENGTYYYIIGGGKYKPATDTWTTVSVVNAPSGAVGHTAIWTGSDMIVWGGTSMAFNVGNSGGKYNPSSDTWSRISDVNQPSGRNGHTSVWTGSEMVVWGGWDGSNFVNTGGKYNPVTDSWSSTSTTNAPAGRSTQAVWTGTEMIVWGGGNVNAKFNSGGRYNPSTNVWVSTPSTNAPDARYSPTAVWTGTEMIIWGGSDGSNSLNSGSKFNPSSNTWSALSTVNAPIARDSHTAVWTGSEMIVWGGSSSGGATYTGGRYTP